MGIVSYGVVASSPSVPTNSQGLESKIIPVNWSSNFGYEAKQDSVTFPLFSAVTRIVSTFPVRVRLYQYFAQQSLDINRPPWVLADTQTKPLVDVLVGQGAENGKILNPTSLIVSVIQVPVTIEKLLPDETTIDLLIYLVG